jgi:uncharacterized membrane protein
MAIIITIMVLELSAPHDTSLDALLALTPVALSYVMSYVYLGIYWNNHHHLFQVVQHVDGRVLWANLHLLFWLSLVPFFTAWMGETHFAWLPVAAYGGVLFMAGTAYFILTRSLLRLHASDSRLAMALGRDFEGKISIAIYAVAIATAAVWPLVAFAAYLVVAIIWLVPDRRIERAVAARDG